MKKLIYIIPFLFCFSLGFAQEKLTKEEKARREKNIQAGNPFARFGYKAKVATLSKGKYLEFHDSDTIVVIGSKYYNTLKQEIVCDIIIDSTNTDRQPTGDTAGRWISPDPLSEEFPDWSPYNMCLNNPIRLVDPDGMAPTDIVILGANNSSFTVKTNLIDVKINASGLGVDFGGNYKLGGKDILQAAVDIAGVFDPTPAMDILGAKLSSDSGDYLGAGASLLGAALPYVGDLAKSGKIAKGLDKISDAIKATDKAKDAKKADFIVTPDGVAVPTNQSVMREGFDNAGFPSRPATQTAENGVIHTVPTKKGKVDVRTMEGSANHPKRAVVTHPGTNNPKTPSGTTTRSKSDNHINQN